MTAEQRRLLGAAPELVVVDLVDTALGALIVAIAVEHPAVDTDDDPWTSAPPTLRRARRLVRAARRLRADLDRYRLEVEQALRDAPDDQMPF